MSSHTAIPGASTDARQRIEIIAGHERRRRFADEDKTRLVAEAPMSDQSAVSVARRHGICSSLLYRWRRDEDLVERRTRPTPPLIPVQIATATQADHAPLATQRVERLVEITLPNGCSVRANRHVDSRAPRRILSALRG
jgi:transposase